MFMKHRVMLACGVTLLAMTVIAGIAGEATHWHTGDDHGVVAGQPLNAIECEALFGGEGWE